MVHAFSNNMGCNNIIRFFVIAITVLNVCFCSESRRSSRLSTSSRAQLNVELYTGPETILSKQISYEGVSLIIGSNYERELKTSEPIYKCILTDLPEWYTGPELLERPRSYRMNPSEERSSEHVSDYFSHFFREFWLCRDPTNANQPVFYKVVNQLISVRDIFEIKYYPYIEVATVDYLGSNKNSAKIKEIKFIYKDGGRFYNLKFDSKLIDEISMDQINSKPQTNPSFKEYAHSIVPMRVGSKGAVKDFLFTPNDRSRKLINISPAGMNLRVGSTWDKKFEGVRGSTTNEFICRREYGLDFPHIFTPECSVKHNLKNSDKSIYAKVTAEDFPRMFTVANREVWLCTNNHGPIYRVVNLVIGRVPIKSIEPEDDIILIDSINITNGVSVIFKEVGFFKFYLLERHDFETPYILKEDDTVRESKLGNSLFWDGRYKLPRMGIYKNIINAKGYDLRIGSKTSGPLSTNVNNLKSSCGERNYFHQDFLTKLRLKMKVDDVVQSNELIEDIDESQHFFKYKNNRVWKCEEKTTNKTFWMIVNVMEVLVAVRVVETFDGVELVQKPASNGTLKLLDIHETKFLDENYNQVIYLGQLEFENNAAIGEVSQIRQSDGEVLRKSLDEIAHRLGGRATRHCYTNLRDINVVYREPKDFSPKQLDKIVGAGDSLLKFELDVTIDDKSVKTKTTPRFALDCEIMKESQEKIYPNFKIFKRDTIVPHDNELRDADKSAKYLIFEGNEIWKCTVPEMKVFRLFRVVVNQHLKKDTNIGKVEYPELDEVEIENEDSDYLVRFKQIRYVSSKTDEHPQIIDFRGYLFLHKSPVPGTVLSGTKILDWTNTKMINNYEKHAVQYDLDRQNLYTDKVIVDYNNLQTEKISLEIGSKWERAYGNRETYLLCVEEDGDSGDHWPEVREKGKIVAADEKVVNLFPTYFNLLHQNRSLCTDKSTQKRILRIENQFSMKSYHEIPRPVEYLSYNERVSVFFGETKTSGIGYEIIEIKYIDPEDQAVLNVLVDRFGQKVVNTTQVYHGISNKKLKSLKQEELDQNFRRDIRYSLREPYEVYRIELDFGMKLEIGQSYSSKDIVSCLLTCKYQPNPEEDLIGNHLPELTILKARNKDNPHEKHDKADIRKYFHLKRQFFWTCKCEDSSGPDLIRIQNILEKVYTLELSFLNHYEGIEVIRQYQYIIIKETKYVRTKDKSVVKFDHYMKFQEVNPETVEWWFVTAATPLRLFDEVMKMTKPSPNGISYLIIGSKWQDTLPVTNDHPVICEREKAHTYAEDLATSVTRSGGGKTTERDLTDFFEQKLWTCKVNEEVKFRRVVNKMLIVNWTEIYRINYFDGVTVETVNLQGVDYQALQVTEIKLVANEVNKIIRYDGQFFIRSNKIVENLFQKSNEMKESGRESTQSQYIPLDVLKFATWKMISNEKSKDEQSSIAKPKGKESTKSENVKNLLKGLSYRPKHFKPYSTEILDEKGMYFHRIFQVGTSYEEEFLADDRSPNTGIKMQCLLDRWNPDKIHNYIPRVSEFIEGEQYLLDRDEFLELFQIEYVKVWICMDDRERYLIRVQSSFVGKEPMLAVRYPDGVTIARHEISREDLSPNPSNTASVTEIIYLDPWSSKVLKYEGDMREVSIPDKTTKSDNADPAPKTENSRIKNPCAALVQRLFGCWKSKEGNGGK